ncbi:MAG: OB-fold domain-containing protein [Myxococcota bacterium]|nr:OB-fold domain-containing protein [Myxococcota bacterium]
MTEYSLPLPVLEGHSADFYGFCKEGELRFQRCDGCGAWRHVPRELCAECGSWEWTWTLSSGKGEVFTYTVVGRALHPAFDDSVPYAVSVVEMEEGVRVLSRVADVEPGELEIGMPVQVDFEAVTDEISLPIFRRVTG